MHGTCMSHLNCSWCVLYYPESTTSTQNFKDDHLGQKVLDFSVIILQQCYYSNYTLSLHITRKLFHPLIFMLAILLYSLQY